jgi:hypothetical protein
MQQSYQTTTRWKQHVRNDKDIIILHVPGTKEIDQQTIYRYLPFSMPIPIFPKAHDLTIAQSLSNQIFNKNDLDYPQEPEALFVSDNFGSIAVSANDKFHI